MKFNLVLFVTLFLFSIFETVSSFHTHFFTHSNLKKKKKPTKVKKKRPIDMLLPDASTYWQGWVKYYHYNNNTHYERPPSLFQNDAYYHQRIPKEKLKKHDEFGSLWIPNKASFYFVLYNNSFALYSKRGDNIIDKMMDHLKLSDIEPVPEDAWLKGGIRNLGEFSFGSCIEIKAELPVNQQGHLQTPQIWLICANTNGDKFHLMKHMLKLKIQEQRLNNNNIRTTREFLKKENKPPALGGLIANPLGKARTPLSVKSPADGYWILLQDWTLCNKKCGGGLQFQQWMCVPPKNGGRPCKKEAVRTKPCNTQPCPSVNNLLTLTKRRDRPVEKPIVKVGPFSNRPQRYSKCYIRENDAFIEEVEPISKTKVKRPVRLVMNNHTISIFRDDTFEDLGSTFELSKTSFAIKKNPCSFDLSDTHKSISVFSYDSECNRETNDWVVGWEKDFKLFKYQCHTGLRDDLISAADEEHIKDKMNNDMSDAEAAQAQNQAIDLKKQQLGKQIRKYGKKKKKVQDNSFKVLSKEIELESMVQNEEKEKEEMEERKLIKMIALEKKKKECLEKSFEERELDTEFQESEKESLEDENDIKLQTQKKIEDGRWRLKKKLMQMKQKSKTRRDQLGEQLLLLRSKMSKEIILANKNGNMKFCKRGRKDIDFRESYCNKAFVEDWVRNSECKSNEEFCYTCCEHEFGLNFVSQRDACYDMCDRKVKKPINFPKMNVKAMKEPSQGKWVWAPKEKAGDSKFK